MRLLCALLMSLAMLQMSAQGVMKINIIVGSKTFTAVLDDSETGKAFYDMLPMTLNMSELNGNEKYNYLSVSLPTNSYHPGTIEKGDLLLYGSSCVVLFYKTFSSGYSYTRIGKIASVEGLEQALGSGSITVRFEKEPTAISAVHAEGKTPKAIYDLHGRLMDTDDLSFLPDGTYVVKDAKGTRKIIK